MGYKLIIIFKNTAGYSVTKLSSLTIILENYLFKNCVSPNYSVNKKYIFLLKYKKI